MIAPPLAAASSPCPPPYCTGNSPEIDRMGLWDLNLDHHPNKQGFVLLGMTRGGRSYDLDVQNSAFLAKVKGTLQLRGKDLQNSTIWLERGTEQYGLVITAVGSVEEVVTRWPPVAGGPPYTALETYILEWGKLPGHPLPGVIVGGSPPPHGGWPVLAPATSPERPMPVCPMSGPTLEDRAMGSVATYRDPDWAAADKVWDESATMPPFNMVVFEGDRIDATTRTVASAADDRWFNLGCARHTLAKLRLSRNTFHTAGGDWRQVQDTLKMLSADYCGTGVAVTVADTPLVWRQQPLSFVGPAPDPSHWMTYHAPPVGPVEARWDENGAICLGKPRLEEHPNPAFPDVRGKIAAACTFKTSGGRSVARWLPCKDLDPTHFGTERITTANWEPEPPSP